MLLKDTFRKDIFRPIDPVVKANEVDHLQNELEEFVVTSEMKAHLQRFFDEYNELDNTGNGAWISGFFGSGKSHLLKIMAVIMEEREVGGRSAMDYVLEKLDDNPALKAALEQSRQQHPSESVLFNIDSFAPNAGRSESGALLAAFIKAFNHHCGFFDGDQQHVAKLEYDLAREGRFDAFKERVETLCGKTWEQVRSASMLYGKNITLAFDEVCGNPEGTTENVISYYQQTYKPDIRSFAQQVGEYIASKDKGFRLNFFVDEVGQFIAHNPKLMVNLQTVAEELDNACSGNSWVVVTSQENMEDVVGQMESSSANDFSKIKDRFKVRMSLTSKEAREVICDRLLTKEPECHPYFEEMYEKYKADFDVLFDFADGSKRYKQYQDVDEFVTMYPFVPYQFEVFSNSLRGLSAHNHFTGKHNSTGARSMLGVFQMVAQRMCSDGASTEEGTLVAFDYVFEGLRNDLKSEVYAAISQAEEHLDSNPTAIRLLKALLLVKYLEDFKATPANLRVLLYGAFSESTTELNEKVKEALDELENQMYVRRNGNVYEYLTDEEKEVEQEIANTLVPEAESHETIADLFRDVCGAAKVTYKNGQFSHSYNYNIQIDGTPIGHARHDLTVNLITDFIDEGLVGGIVPAPPKTLGIALRKSKDFLVGVRKFKQTEKYTNIAVGTGEKRASIIHDKQQANQALYIKLRKDLEELLTRASYSAGGVDVSDSVTGTGKDTVDSALQELVRRSYTNLQQIGKNITDNDVAAECVATKAFDLPEYCESVLSRIRLVQSGATVTVAGEGTGSLIGYFTKNEYGWPEVAVRSALAQLYAQNKIEISRGGSNLEGAALADALKKKQYLDQLVVTTVEEVSGDQIESLKAAFRTFADTSPKDSEPKSIAKELEGHVKSFLGGIESSASAARSYPFAAEFTEKLAKIQSCAANAADWHWVLNQFPEQAADLTEAKKSLQQMRDFAAGSKMSERWSQLRSFLSDQAASLRELGIDDENMELIQQVVSDAECYKNEQIPDAYKAMTDLKAQFDSQITQMKEEAKTALSEYRATYESLDLASVPEEAQSRFASIFDNAQAELASLDVPHRIASFVDAFKAGNASKLFALLNPPTPGDGGEEPHVVTAVSIRDVKAKGYAKPAITSAEDAQTYIDGLKAGILEELDNGKIVSI